MVLVLELELERGSNRREKEGGGSRADLGRIDDEISRREKEVKTSRGKKWRYKADWESIEEIGRMRMSSR